MKLPKQHTMALVTLATLLVTAGTAGVIAGVGAPTTDDRGATPHAAGEHAAASSSDDVRGPTVRLPDQVPDHVGEVHDLVREFLLGHVVEPLGAVIEDVTPGAAGKHADGGA